MTVMLTPHVLYAVVPRFLRHALALVHTGPHLIDTRIRYLGNGQALSPRLVDEVYITELVTSKNLSVNSVNILLEVVSATGQLKVRTPPSSGLAWFGLDSNVIL